MCVVHILLYVHMYAYKKNIRSIYKHRYVLAQSQEVCTARDELREEVQTCMKNISRLEEMNEDLQSQLHQQREQNIADTEAKIGALRDTVRKLQQEQTDSRTDNENKNITIRQLKGEVQSMQKKHHETVEAKTKLQDELIAANSKIRIPPSSVAVYVQTEPSKKATFNDDSSSPSSRLLSKPRRQSLLASRSLAEELLRGFPDASEQSSSEAEEGGVIRGRDQRTTNLSCTTSTNTVTERNNTYHNLHHRNNTPVVKVDGTHIQFTVPASPAAPATSMGASATAIGVGGSTAGKASGRMGESVGDGMHYHNITTDMNRTQMEQEQGGERISRGSRSMVLEGARELDRNGDGAEEGVSLSDRTPGKSSVVTRGGDKKLIRRHRAMVENYRPITMDISHIGPRRDVIADFERRGEVGIKKQSSWDTIMYTFADPFSLVDLIEKKWAGSSSTAVTGGGSNTAVTGSKASTVGCDRQGSSSHTSTGMFSRLLSSAPAPPPVDSSGSGGVTGGGDG
eukprot:GHVQ01015833.1.p1 GENE.GHVQ01015833.1~~GHVQ01015833.1.p1  ORF type:complete len:511 (+),score=115.97 GHVQ01015833.1:119-1651(+)